MWTNAYLHFDFVVELLERGVQLMLNDDLRNDLAGARSRDVLAASLPEDDVEDYIVEVRIVLVAVMFPILGAQMQLDIACAFCFVANLHRGLTEVGAGFEVPPTPEDDAHGATVGRLQGTEFQPLVVPDALDKPFANRDGA